LGGIGHAILAARIDNNGPTVILDNRNPTVVDAKLVKDEYTPALGINEDSWSVYVGPQ